MDAKINIAEILKDKPQGTKLYDLLYNIDVELDTISTTDTETVVWCTNETDNKTTCHRGYSEFGTVRGCTDGLQILLPSKEMRDWRKFNWKKGDVLVNKDGDVYIIFERFADDTYCSFVGKYYLWKENNDTEHFYKNERLLTSDFQKAGKDAAQTYLKTIEKRLGGKLNRETLEVEKAQPEFKDGDIITFKDRIIIIYNNSIEKYPNRTEIYYHACLKEGELTVNEYLMSCGFGEGWYSSTEEEKQQLFDALAKKGKAWDTEKKQIVDLKPKFDELKPFDNVLVRDSESDKWRANLFGYIDKDEYYHCVYANWVYCIPYAGNEHLLGTTKDVEG